MNSGNYHQIGAKPQGGIPENLWWGPSSENQEQIVAARESLNGRKNMAFFTFLRAIFFPAHFTRLSLAPTICPWVSEDGWGRARQQKDFLKSVSSSHISLSLLFIWNSNDK